MSKRSREPKTPRGPQDPPKEAKLILDSDYRYLDELSTEGWYTELTRLFHLSEENELGLHEPDRNTVVVGEGCNAITVKTGVPPVEFVDSSDEGFLITPERLPALIIDANATDEVIKKRFKEAMEELRRCRPPPVAKSGPHQMNNDIGEKAFDKWRRDKIVQLAELLAWRAKLDKQKRRAYPDFALGAWLFGEESEAGPKVSAAKATLKKAIANRGAIHSQITQDTPPQPPTFDLIPHILRGIKQTKDERGEPQLQVPSELRVTFVEPLKPRN